MAKIKQTVTVDGTDKGNIKTEFMEVGYGDADKPTMNFPTRSNTTKSTGEDVLAQFPMPI